MKYELTWIEHRRKVVDADNIGIAIEIVMGAFVDEDDDLNYFKVSELEAKKV